MIGIYGKNFYLATKNTSYLFKINSEGMPEHLHYGAIIPAPESEEDSVWECLTEKIDHGKSTAIEYRPKTLIFPEDMLLETSSVGVGDYRVPMVVLEMPDGSRTGDFLYESHELFGEPQEMQTLPTAYIEREAADGESAAADCVLKLTLKEREHNVRLHLYYTVFADCDVITRRVVVENSETAPIHIETIMSMQLDLDADNYSMYTFNGNWGREMGMNCTPLNSGLHVNRSVTGCSSNRANPFIMVAEAGAGEHNGEVYGFNLLYSGNHYEACEVSGFHKTRVVCGIEPSEFSWKLEPGEQFESPEAVMTFSSKGFEGISAAMHPFVRRHIVRGQWRDKSRPILINSWEAAYMNINEGKLLRLASKAKEAGMELFVCDDGWFKGRNNDTSSLGDWVEDTKKLPGGLKSLGDKIHNLGMLFGIWVEPEMVNEDSDLFRAHPEYALTVPGRVNALGRNQMVLDLTNPKVVEFIKESLRYVYTQGNVDYVKWDYNRMFSDVFSKALPGEGRLQTETAHRYMLGLYEIMKWQSQEFPQVLFEGCASGGNRFDLGILSYMPQIWASDDTDAMERTVIQKGYSYGYPQSTEGCHVSACPNHQTLRNVPLETRFAIAANGLLGYELNLLEMTGDEFEAVKVQVALYKEWRDVFAYGQLYRLDDTSVMVLNEDHSRAVITVWNRMVHPNEFYRKIRTIGLDENRVYHIYNIPSKLNIKDFGGLINTIAPIHVRQGSLLHNVIAKLVKIDSEVEDYRVKGGVLNNAGIKLCQAFGGTGLDKKTRVFQDFASRMYFIEAEEEVSAEE